MQYQIVSIEYLEDEGYEIGQDAGIEDQIDQELLIARLPCDIKRIALLMADGWNYRQIAGITGIPIGTIMSKIHRYKICNIYGGKR